MDAQHSGEVVIRVTGLCGSIRPGSYTRMALQVALRGAASVGAAADLIDLRDYVLPFGGAGGDRTPDVEGLASAIKSADGLLLGTPEYHNSFSGVLKNALDLMGFDEFESKMVGLVGVSGGTMGAFHALDGLRNVGRALHAWVVPEQASVPEAWKVFDNEGRLSDQRIEERLLEVGKQVAQFARLHKCAAAHEFLKSWEAAPQNPGA